MLLSAFPQVQLSLRNFTECDEALLGEFPVFANKQNICARGKFGSCRKEQCAALRVRPGILIQTHLCFAPMSTGTDPESEKGICLGDTGGALFLPGTAAAEDLLVSSNVWPACWVGGGCQCRTVETSAAQHANIPIRSTHWLQVGVTSFTGYGGCGSGEPSGAVNAATYAAWIQRGIQVRGWRSLGAH